MYTVFTMVDTVFFDFDGVLTLNPNGYTITPQNIQKMYPDLSEDFLVEQYLIFGKELQKGTKTHYDIWSEYCDRIGVEIDPSVLEKVFLDTPLNEEMVALARVLRGREYQVGMITNNTWERLDTILKANSMENDFDPLVVSARVGSLKSDPDIFEHTLKSSDRSPDQCLFIDNQKKNLVVPRGMGMHTYLHDDQKNDMQAIREHLESMGITVPSF